MHRLKLIVLLVIAVAWGTLVAHAGNCPANAVVWIGLPPALALIVWAVINSD